MHIQKSYRSLFIPVVLTFHLCVLNSVNAQSNQNSLDSLQAILKNASNDTIRMEAYSNLGFYYFSKNTDSAHFYLGQGILMARQLNLKLYESGLLSGRGYLFSFNDYPKAWELLTQALTIAEDPSSERTAWHLQPGQTSHSDRLSYLGGVYFSIAQLYGNTGNVPKQISSLVQAKNIAESIHDSALNVIASLNLGDAYYRDLKNLDSAVYFQERAIEVLPRSGKADNDIGWAYHTLGEIFQQRGDMNRARNYYESGLLFMETQNNLAGTGGISLTLSGYFKLLKNTDSSMVYARSALKSFAAYGDKGGIARAYSVLSSLFHEQGKVDSAFFYMLKSYTLQDSLDKLERNNLLAYLNANFDEQIRLKNLENEKIKSRNKLRTYLMMTAIVVFALVAFLLIKINRNRKKANKLLQKQKDKVEIALSQLKSTQAQLIQFEKMASLGELTAGIAHEIQNPLNFVNNFSEVNREMLAEMKEELDKGNAGAAKDIANDVMENEEKIHHHGKRADSIVKGMLEHSRSSTGQKEQTDINKLVDEYLRLAYQGIRAKDRDFTAVMKTDFDDNIGNIDIIAQDIGRVLLNLYNNGFYAVNEKKKTAGNDEYKPRVEVKTKKANDKIRITVTDNGNGIPQNIIEKIFQPFFTTKPTGQGTGLGLSLAYDIVKAHGGELKVNSVEAKYSEFVVVLPC